MTMTNEILFCCKDRKAIGFLIERTKHFLALTEDCKKAGGNLNAKQTSHLPLSLQTPKNEFADFYIFSMILGSAKQHRNGDFKVQLSFFMQVLWNTRNAALKNRPWYRYPIDFDGFLADSDQYSILDTIIIIYLVSEKATNKTINILHFRFRLAFISFRYD